jgi:hypothetical protein
MLTLKTVHTFFELFTSLSCCAHICQIFEDAACFMRSRTKKLSFPAIGGHQWKIFGCLDTLKLVDVIRDFDSLKYIHPCSVIVLYGV